MRKETKDLIRTKVAYSQGKGPFIHVRDIRSILKMEYSLLQETCLNRKKEIEHLKNVINQLKNEIRPQEK